MFVLFMITFIAGSTIYTPVDFYNSKAICKADEISKMQTLNTPALQETYKYECANYKEVWDAKRLSKESYPMHDMNEYVK